MLSPAKKIWADFTLASVLTFSCLISAHLAAFLIGRFV